jgi:molecular chaperone DnaJ
MGQVRHTSSTFFGNFTQVMPCPTCDGQGTKIDRPCEICKGHGQVRKTRTCDLKVPAGVNNGARLHVVGAGDQGRKGAPPGDLYVVLHVKPHSRFEREGYTIHLRQPVSFAMAALGGEMLVDTVGGPHLLKIPAGVQTGHTLIMKDLGVPHLRSNQKRGDQQVHLHIETPTKLTDEQKQLLKQFSELRGESLNVSPDQQPKTPEGQQSIFDVIAGVFKPKNGGDE